MSSSSFHLDSYVSRKILSIEYAHIDGNFGVNNL